MKLTKNQQIWIEALRSGKYEQGKCTLKQTNHEDKTRHCCLGIACELFDPHCDQLCMDATPDSRHTKEKSKGTYASILTIERLCLYEMDGSICASKVRSEDRDEGLTYKSLAAMNDNGYSFEAIADFIERNPESVFTEGSD